MQDRTKRRLSAIAFFVFLLLCVAAGTVLFWDSLTEMVADPQAFRERMEGYGIGGKLLFVALMAAQVILAPVPGHPFEVVAGYSFGILWGTLLTVLGALIGSVIAFWLSRIFGANVVKMFYNEEKLQKVSFLRTSNQRTMFAFVFFLIPGVPKDMLAYFMGLTTMPLGTFILISTVGRLPGIFVAVLGGAAASERSALLIALFIAAFLLIIALTAWLSRYRKA
ncbi:MAG: TVP38/TMEM64 family protein [Ruminococcaceae bacterium]|nr:TVP38/TMEM64 family protein [Oscillospiraceae bacterium]